MIKKLWIALLLSGVCVSLHAAQTNIPPSEIQDTSLSVEQLQEAAAAGDPDAQYALGYMYYYGKNVPQNTATGLNWIKRASVQGQDQAIQAMHLLAPSESTLVANDQSQPVPNATPPVAVGTIPPAKKFPPKKAPTVTTSQQVSAFTPVTPAMVNTPNDYYTIQLLVTAHKAELERYIQTHALGSNATYYATKHNGRESYVLLYGAYKTRSEAQASLSKLPAAVKAHKPWIKQISQVKGK